MAKTERKVREYLSDWKPWIIIAYLGLAGLVVVLYFISGNTSRTQIKISRDEAIHQSEITSNAKAVVTSCLNSIPTLVNANKLVVGVKVFHQAVVDNLKRSLDATPTNDPQYEIRVKNYLKAYSTIPLVSDLHFVVPTKKECRARGKAVLDKDKFGTN